MEAVVKKTVVLNIKCETLMKSLEMSGNIRIYGNQICKTMTVPHSGFGLFGPQIITGTLQPQNDKTEIQLRVRPSIAEMVFLAVFISGSLISAVLMLFEKCAPLFCLMVTLLTVVRLCISMWERQTCLSMFVQNLTRKYT